MHSALFIKNFYVTFFAICLDSIEKVLIFHIFSALAEMELGLIRERTLLGLQAARERGKTLGRPKGISNPAKKKALLVKKLYEDGHATDEICEQLSISKATIYKYLRSVGSSPSRKKTANA